MRFLFVKSKRRLWIGALLFGFCAAVSQAEETDSCRALPGDEANQSECEAQSLSATNASPVKALLAKWYKGTPQEIFAKVTREISYEPYRGSMRPPALVAQVRHANALDQAIFLQQMLTEARYQARLVRGSLSPAMQQRMEESFQSLTPTTIAHNDHYWVEYQQDQRWLALDPTFPDAQWGKAYGKRLGTLSEQALAKLTQRVRFTLRVQTADDKTQVLGSHTFAVADLVEQPVSLVIRAMPPEPPRRKSGLGNAMGGFGSALGGASKAPKNLVQRYLPQLMVGDEIHKLPTYPASKTGASAQIATEWLDIDFMLGEEVLISRQRILHQASADQNAPPELRHYVATVLATFVTEAFAAPVRNRYAQRLKAMPEKQSPESVETHEMQMAQAAGHLMGLEFALASDALTQKFADAQRAAIFHPQPRLYIASSEGSQSSKKHGGFQLQALALDLRLDEIDIHPSEGSEAILFQLGRSLQQAVLEERWLEALPNIQSPSYTTTRVMDAAQQADIPLITLLPGSAPGFEALPQLPTSLKPQLRAALDAGHHLVIPEQPVPLGGKSRWAWWDIDPSTGRAVGVIERGLHGAIVEYTVMTKDVAVDDQRALVLGMLVGSMQTHMRLASAILAGVPVTDALKARIEEIMEQIACASCLHAKAEANPLSASGTYNCVELLKLSIYNKSKSVALPFCEAYAKGFLCAAKAVLYGLEGTRLELNKPVEVKSSLTCGR